MIEGVKDGVKDLGQCEAGSVDSEKASHYDDCDDCGMDRSATRTRTPLAGRKNNDSGRSVINDLPSHLEMSSATFKWADIDGRNFIQMIDAAYAEIVHWRRNIFMLPLGKAGKDFVMELARLFNSYAAGSALESISIKAAMTAPALLLQKPSPTSKTKDHTEILARRLRAWHNGDIAGLVREGRVIQQHLPKPRIFDSDDSREAAKFAGMMSRGKTRAALRMISSEGRGRVLPLDTEVPSVDKSQRVIDESQDKHPEGQPACAEAIVGPQTISIDTHSVLFDQITGESIRAAALRCQGSAGPSGLDAHAWKRICTAFKGASDNICEALALFSRRLACRYVDPEGLSAFTACRLLALDKCPGVRPIGVGEVVRRIVGKAILTVVKQDIETVAGNIQLCAGQKAGAEAAIHAMRFMFNDSDAEAVLLVDASNAFNRLNRQVALRNVLALCPSIATVLVNTYRRPTELFVDGQTLYSREGTTQGDPLSMAFYALATVPLIQACRVDQLHGEVWFADDATGAGKIVSLHRWWCKLNEKGPSFGYFPNGTKTWLIVRDGLEEKAAHLFYESGVQVTTDGR